MSFYEANNTGHVKKLVGTSWGQTYKLNACHFNAFNKQPFDILVNLHFKSQFNDSFLIVLLDCVKVCTLYIYILGLTLANFC